MGALPQVLHANAAPAPVPAPRDDGAELCRLAAALHEAVLNQELIGMRIAARRLCAFARVHRLGPVAWHAAAIEALLIERHDALPRLAQLFEGLELAVEQALAHRFDPN